MKAVVDTSVWSLALRRRVSQLNAEELKTRDELDALMFERDIVLVGPVRQELLTGISDAGFFARLQQQLRAFPDEPLTTEDFERAAEFSNRCRASGIAGSPTDFLICAIAYRQAMSIFTLNRDFSRYATAIPVQLHSVRS